MCFIRTRRKNGEGYSRQLYLEGSKLALPGGKKEERMDGRYAKESRRLDAMAEVLAMIADDFADEKTMERALAGHVVAGMMVRQIGVLDKALDDVIAQAMGDGHGQPV